MNATLLAAAGLVLAAALPAAAAERRRKHYVPCPPGYEGKCGDIPGMIPLARGQGESVCRTPHASADQRFAERKNLINDWMQRVNQIKSNLAQIGSAIGGLGNQYAPQGKEPPLSELSGFVRDDLKPRLVDPLAAQLATTAQCFAQTRKQSDGCYHPACGDTATIMRNIENLQPSIDRIEDDLRNKRAQLLSGLPTSILVGQAPNQTDRCAGSAPGHPCQQHMARSLNQLAAAVQATSRLAGEVHDDE